MNYSERYDCLRQKERALYYVKRMTRNFYGMIFGFVAAFVLKYLQMYTTGTPIERDFAMIIYNFFNLIAGVLGMYCGYNFINVFSDMWRFDRFPACLKWAEM